MEAEVEGLYRGTYSSSNCFASSVVPPWLCETGEPASTDSLGCTFECGEATGLPASDSDLRTESRLIPSFPRLSRTRAPAAEALLVLMLILPVGLSGCPRDTEGHEFCVPEDAARLRLPAPIGSNGSRLNFEFLAGSGPVVSSEVEAREVSPFAGGAPTLPDASESYITSCESGCIPNAKLCMSCCEIPWVEEMEEGRPPMKPAEGIWL